MASVDNDQRQGAEGGDGRSLARRIDAFSERFAELPDDEEVERIASLVNDTDFAKRIDSFTARLADLPDEEGVVGIVDLVGDETLLTQMREFHQLASSVAEDGEFLESSSHRLREMAGLVKALGSLDELENRLDRILDKAQRVSQVQESLLTDTKRTNGRSRRATREARDEA